MKHLVGLSFASSLWYIKHAIRFFDTVMTSYDQIKLRIIPLNDW